MFDIIPVRQEHTNAAAQLPYEVNTLWKVSQETDWCGNTKHFPNAHHGYMMMCFVRIDLLSLYWKLPYDPIQTPREQSSARRYAAFGRRGTRLRAANRERTGAGRWGKGWLDYSKRNDTAG
jgi:hypothetical protein